MKVEGANVAVPPAPALKVPEAERALQDPDTLREYQRIWKRIWLDGLIRFVPFGVFLVIAKVGDDPYAGAAAFFTMLAGFLPIGAARRMSRLLLVKRVLEARPWQPCSVVRVPKGERGRRAIGVRLGGGEEHWVTPVLTVRAPRRKRRLAKEFDGGAWFAGRAETGGVIALPGAREITLAYVRTKR